MIFVVLGVLLAIGVAGATIYAAYVDHVDTELDRAYERAHERQTPIGTPRRAYDRGNPPDAQDAADTAELAGRRAAARHVAETGLPTTGIDDSEYRHADDGDDAVVAESRHRFDGRHARTA